MYIDELTVTNFRCFSRQNLDFNWPKKPAPKGAQALRMPNVNLLIGNNGTGKTTIFQALVLAALGPYLVRPGMGFLTPSVVRYGSPAAEASAKIYLSSIDTDAIGASGGDQHFAGHTVTSTIEGPQRLFSSRARALKWKERLIEEDSPSSFMVAYGAGRRTERPEGYSEPRRTPRHQRIATLFEQYVGLLPMSRAYSLCREHERWSEVVGIVNRLLPRVRLAEEDPKDGEPMFHYDGIPLPASELSDGYRLFIAWLIDCLTRMAQVVPESQKLTDTIGTIIVDEVDLFLAPAWQRTVLESLSTEFRQIQWFCSTHSPLVAGSLESENIYILESSEPYTSRIRRPTDDFEGKSVEKVLMDLFRVGQPRSPELQRRLRSLSKRAMDGDVEASKEYLRLLGRGTARG